MREDWRDRFEIQNWFCKGSEENVLNNSVCTRNVWKNTEKVFWSLLSKIELLEYFWIVLTLGGTLKCLSALLPVTQIVVFNSFKAILQRKTQLHNSNCILWHLDPAYLIACRHFIDATAHKLHNGRLFLARSVKFTYYKLSL